jgi:lipid-binding SYLF domain-containing protein
VQAPEEGENQGESQGEGKKALKEEAKEQYLKLKDKFDKRVSMEGLLSTAVESFEALLRPKEFPLDDTLPLLMFEQAKGALFLTVIKGGFGVGGSIGTGLILLRLPYKAGWSAPAAVGIGGVNWGLQIGAAKTDHIMALKEKAAVDTFLGKGQLKLGGDAAIAIAKEGRSANAAVSLNEKGQAAAILSYSHSSGAYIGVSLDGQLIVPRADCNEKFYGKKLSVKDILTSNPAELMPADKRKTWSRLTDLLEQAVDRQNYQLGEEE